MTRRDGRGSPPGLTTAEVRHASVRLYLFISGTEAAGLLDLEPREPDRSREAEKKATTFRLKKGDYL